MINYIIICLGHKKKYSYLDSFTLHYYNSMITKPFVICIQQTSTSVYCVAKTPNLTSVLFVISGCYQWLITLITDYTVINYKKIATLYFAIISTDKRHNNFSISKVDTKLWFTKEKIFPDFYLCRLGYVYQYILIM